MIGVAIADGTDCDDAVASIYPGAPEIPEDEIDQDCNGVDATTCYLDADMDGYGTDVGTTVIALDGNCDMADGESDNMTDCDDAVSVGEGLVERLLRVVFFEMPQEAQDQLRADAELAPAIQQSLVDALDHGGEGNPPAGVCLGVEEDLRVQDVVAMDSRQVRPGQVVEILLGQEDACALIVEIQEFLKAVKLVGGSQILDRSVREINPVAARDLEHQLRLQRAFDVHV